MVAVIAIVVAARGHGTKEAILTAVVCSIVIGGVVALSRLATRPCS